MGKVIIPVKTVFVSSKKSKSGDTTVFWVDKVLNNVLKRIPK